MSSERVRERREEKRRVRCSGGGEERRDGAQGGEVRLLARDAPGGRARGGARRRGVRARAGGQDGAQAGPVRGGHAEPPVQGVAGLLRADPQHRAQPQVPVRRHAVRHRAPGRRQARRRHDHPQALRHRQPPHRLQMRPVHPAVRSRRGATGVWRSCPTPGSRDCPTYTPDAIFVMWNLYLNLSSYMNK